jgi:F-type H+-transporting ATPase subunit gamma
MASAREIRRRIKSVRNTGKITKAMELVSASKMRRAQRNVLATRPYTDRLYDVMGELTARSLGGSSHPLLQTYPSVTRVGLIVVTPDRGLCGALNSNIFRAAARFIADQRGQGRTVTVLAIGKKGRDFALRTGQNLVAQITGLGDSPPLVDVLPAATVAIDSYKPDENGQHQLDEVYLLYSEFVNTLTQRPKLRRFLPVETPADAGATKVDYTYEPSQQGVLEQLLPRFVEVQLYQAILESIASEHSARMIAMRNANDNAKELVRDLTLTYNKARQAAITKEISEIAAGVAAQ